MDKQDELLKVIAQAEVAYYRDIHSSAWGLPETIAAAVRSFMGSPEVVNRAERAAAEAGGVEVGSLDVPVVQMTRAALSAAIGEDIGGGRG